ncbi:DNA-3-methyladenine glycosylase I [Paenibacillus chartarius]|uniref:DNA-3-methyladenine glycosylase I n=1 Tax=Paenibacillus chartarius TaxID=747481 RepID=A0ABV6DVH8_9BACL
MTTGLSRCGWVNDDPLYIKYHDEEWGVPVRDDLKLFEMLNLEGAQAGLSWYTILRKRDNYRRAFDNFDPALIAQYDDAKIESLLQDEGIVRNRLKVHAVVTNAKAYMQLKDELGSFSDYLWGFVGGEQQHCPRPTLQAVPAKTPESDRMSKELKKRGFKFVGSTICYAFMQATGMVDDHVDTCFKAQSR